MKGLFAALATVLILSPAFAQQQTEVQQKTVQMQCHTLASSGNFLNPDETLINGMACHPATATSPVIVAAVAPAPANSALVATPALAAVPAPVATSSAKDSVVAPDASSACLIVRQAEGHRFRNSMVAGVLTGGIGLAAGLAFSGGRYEYVDALNMANTKMKYKGPELQKLQDQGVHVVVVNKKAQADEIKAARQSCEAK